MKPLARESRVPVVWMRLWVVALPGLAALAMGAAPVPVPHVKDAIGPASADFMMPGIAKVAGTGAPMVVIQLDKPGGLDISMRNIIRAVLASRVPVAVYLSPQGARAASAGTYVLYAANIAAMAPADARAAGQVHDASAFIRGLAQQRGRNAEWAERTVREAVSLAAAAALREKVIDVVAEDIDDQLALTTLRVVLGKHELHEMLAEHEPLNVDVQQILDTEANDWGIKVSNVEIKHIDLKESMVHAIARQAEAERERRAKVIHAEGEKQASASLLEAARMLAREPEAMQLRYLQTMTQVAGDRAATVVLPLPLELPRSLLGRSSNRGAGTAGHDPSFGRTG